MTQTGPLARMNGRPIDELRVPLIEEGFLPPDTDGGYGRNITNELMDLIRRERAGEPVYRASDAQRAASLDRAGGLPMPMRPMPIASESMRSGADGLEHPACGPGISTRRPCATRPKA